MKTLTPNAIGLVRFDICGQLPCYGYQIAYRPVSGSSAIPSTTGVGEVCYVLVNVTATDGDQLLGRLCRFRSQGQVMSAQMTPTMATSAST